MDAAFRELDYDGVFSYYNRQPLSSSSRSPSRAEMTMQRSAAGAAQAGSRPPRRVVRAQGAAHAGFRRRLPHRHSAGHVPGSTQSGDGVERERIVHLNGPPREILRVGDEVTYMLQSATNCWPSEARPRRAPTTACSGAATTK